MADGAIASSIAAPSNAGKGLLFPVEPATGETLLSYIVRCVERNHLGTPVQFLRQAAIDLSISGDLLGRLQRSLPLLEDLVGEPLGTQARLWGAEALDEQGRRRLGGVFLRPQLIDQARRRVDPKLAKGEGDQAIWMVRHFDFCPRSWNVLVRQCPNRFCAKPLTWPRADSLHLCRHCREPLDQGKPEKVPKVFQPVLSWLASLFSDCETERQAAMRKVPTAFRLSSETDVYEFVVAMVHARSLMGQAEDDDASVGCSYKSLHAAASFVLDYPRSRWDILQKRPRGQRDKFYGIMARISRDTAVPIVRDTLRDILSDSPIMLLPRDRRPPTGELTSRGAASLLGVPPGDVTRLVDAGLLTPLSSSGTQRKQYLFDYQTVNDMRDELTEGLADRVAASDLAIPVCAIPQLVALNILRRQPSKVSVFLRGDHRVDARDVEVLAEWVNRRPVVERSRKWIPLSEAFTAIGGRDKPWGTVIKAALARELPGGLVFVRTLFDAGVISMSRLVARELLSGGPQSLSPLAFRYEAFGATAPAWMTPGEVMDYLNCSAVEISWLRERNLLMPQKWISPTIYDRADVEAFGHQWMTTREAAARLEVEPRGLWRLIEAHPVEPGLGRGFYPRSDLEGVVRSLAFERETGTWPEDLAPFILRRTA